MRHSKEERVRACDREVITTAFVAGLYFGGHLDNARCFMQMQGEESADELSAALIYAKVQRNSNSKRKEEPHVGFLKSYMRKEIETEKQTLAR